MAHIFWAPFWPSSWVWGCRQLPSSNDLKVESLLQWRMSLDPFKVRLADHLGDGDSSDAGARCHLNSTVLRGWCTHLKWSLANHTAVHHKHNMHVCNNLQQITLPHDATHSCLQCSTMIQTATHHNAFTSTAICRKSHCHMTQCAMNAYMSTQQSAANHTATWCDVLWMHTCLQQPTANCTVTWCIVHISTAIYSKSCHRNIMQCTHIYNDLQHTTRPCNATCTCPQRCAANHAAMQCNMRTSTAICSKILPQKHPTMVSSELCEGNAKGDGDAGGQQEGWWGSGEVMRKGDRRGVGGQHEGW